MTPQVEIKDIQVKTAIGTKIAPNSTNMVKLYKMIEEIPKTTIVRVDFQGVSLGALANDEKFKSLIIDRRFSNVFIRLYGEANLKSICDMMMSVMGIQNANKVINVVPDNRSAFNIENMFAPTAGTKAVTEILLEKGMEIDNRNNRCILHYDMHNGAVVLSTFTSSKDVIGIYNAMKEALRRTGLKSVVVDFGRVRPLTGRKESLADLLYQARRLIKDSGCEAEYIFRDELSIKNWGLAVGIEMAEKNYKKSLEEISQSLRPNMVGMLAEYIPDEGKVDRLGRYGNGVVHTRQPAIFLGIEGDRLKFRKFIGSSFMRRADWDKKNFLLAQELLELGEKVEVEEEFKLRSVDMDVHISEIGIARINYGTKFHFSLPIQTKESEMVEVWAWNRKNNRFENVKILLPKFIQLVLDENNVFYDRAELEMDIGLTEHKLRNQGIEVPDTRAYQFMKRGH